MNYYVYILQSEKDQGFYVGMSKDLEHRLREHNQGRVQSTQFRKPFQLIYTEIVNDRKLARVREKYWKSGVGREKIIKILNQSLADLPMGKS